MSAEDAVALALAANPQVRAAKSQYEAALRGIAPAYAPQDPVLSLGAANSVQGFGEPEVETLGVSESFQFPGKAWLQGAQARRAAELARLSFAAAQRDVRAQVKTAYYQALLDGALAESAQENASNLARVLKVAEVAYAANHVTQSDVISAEFDLAQASQSARASVVAEANDEAALNALLARPARSELRLAADLDLKPLALPLDELVRRGLSARQELLQAALTEKNAETARSLARLSFLPDVTASYTYSRYRNGGLSPAGGTPSDNTAVLSFNVPVFFWFHQREDAAAASKLLEAARAGQEALELQTEASIVELYRAAQLGYDTAVLYRDSLLPLARQDFQVALVAYQSGKVDFNTLAGALQRIYSARVSYLTAANQFLAGRVALEQAIGSVSSL